MKVISPKRLMESVFPTVRNGGIFNTSSLDLQFARTKTLDPRITFTRASSGTYVGSDGLIKTATTNEARFDHNPATGESLGLLVEEQRTNLLLQSESIDNVSNWNRMAGGIGTTPAITANSIVSPDGSTTADQVVLALNGGTTVNDSSYVTQSYSSTSGTTYVVSMWLRTVSGTAVISFDVDSQNINTITVTSTWQRFSFARTTSTTASRTFRFGLRGTFNTSDSATLYVWGAQLEAGSFPTSYIPTTTATVTRSADVASITGANFSSWYRQDEGTIYFKGSSLRATGSPATRNFQFEDGTSNNNIRTAGTVTLQVINAAATQCNLTATPNIALDGSLYDFASAYKVDDFATSNGGAASVDNSGTVPVVDRLFLGGGSSAGILNGAISRLTYWPQRLPNSTLQAVTQ